MIYELNQPSSNNLFIDCPFPEALAIIEGSNPGWVFVDDLMCPTAALVWAQGIRGFYLVGDINCVIFREELDVYTDLVLSPRLHNLGITRFEISGDENWDPVICTVFRERNIESSQQLVYRLNPTGQKSVPRPKVAAGCMLKKVDKHLLADRSTSNKKFILSKIIQFWGNVDAFLNTGSGYVLVDGGEIASLCFSGFVAGNTHVIDIETEVSQLRKGYAEMVAREFVVECIEKQLQLHWDCMAENIASSRLAEKLGFTQNRVYNLYSFPLQL